MNTCILSGAFHVDLRSVRLLICMTMLYASVKPTSCFAVAAFTPSTTVPRFGRASKIVPVKRRFVHKKDFTHEEIETFRSKIEKFKLPDPSSNGIAQELSAQPRQIVRVMQEPLQLAEYGSDKGDEIMRDVPTFGAPLEGLGFAPKEGAYSQAQLPEHGSDEGDELMHDVPTFGATLKELGIAPTEGAYSKGAPSEGAFSLLNVVAGFFKSRKVDEKATDRAAEGAALYVADNVADEREIAVVVGSEINVCESDVERDLKELVHDFLLLAQLVARKTAAGNNDAYWVAYWEVLVHIAWLEVGASKCTISAFKNNLSIHQQIVPFLTAAFVPPTTAASILTGIIRGLGDMDATTPWVALFERSATKTDGASLHFSTTSISPDNRVWLDLLSVSLKADDSCFQALFAQHAGANARLEIVQKRLETTPRCLRELKTNLEEKAAPYKEREMARLFKQL